LIKLWGLACNIASQEMPENHMGLEGWLWYQATQNQPIGFMIA
jgi:hypothetical protein